MRTPQRPASASVSPWGRFPSMGLSDDMPTNLSASISAEIICTLWRSVILRQFSVANTSTENFPLISVAVVMMGVAPMPAAILAVRRLLPPICPERRAIAYLPCSSTQTTAGSTSLVLTYGAMSLTAIPVAPTNTIASTDGKVLAVHSSDEHCIISMPSTSWVVLHWAVTSSPSRESLILRAVLHPFAVNAMIAILISASPPR